MQRLISGLLLIIALSACNLANAPVETEEVNISMTIVSTATSVSSATLAPTITAVPTTVATDVPQGSTTCSIPVGWVTYEVQSGDTLFSIAQRANNNVDTLVNANCLESANVLNVGQVLYVPQAISGPVQQDSTINSSLSGENIYYWLASESIINDNSVTVGCSSYLTPIITGLIRGPSVEGNILEALNALFDAQPSDPYRNYWYNGFDATNVSIDANGFARITINGDFLLESACGDPVIVNQLLLSIFTEPSVQSAIITVDGNNLAQMTDMSGRSGADARFTRNSIQYRAEQNQQDETSTDNIVYWLGSEVPESGYSIAIGCETYQTRFDTGIPRTDSAESNIHTALNALFNSPHTGYRNHWQGLSVASVSIENDIANVVINGDDFLLGGACSDPEILAQVLLIVFAEPEVRYALITVNGMNLRQISDASGRSGADALFSPDSIQYVQ